MYSIPPCLTLSNIRYVSRVKWSNPGKRVALSPTPLCSSYWKESLRITLGYGRQLYFALSRGEITVNETYIFFQKAHLESAILIPAGFRLVGTPRCSNYWKGSLLVALFTFTFTYSNVTVINLFNIICLYTGKWFQEFLCNMIDSI